MKTSAADRSLPAPSPLIRILDRSSSSAAAAAAALYSPRIVSRGGWIVASSINSFAFSPFKVGSRTLPRTRGAAPPLSTISREIFLFRDAFTFFLCLSSRHFLFSYYTTRFFLLYVYFLLSFSFSRLARARDVPRV